MDVAPDTLLERMKQSTPPVVLDVRSRAEYDSGHVPGALHFPFWKLIFSMPPLPAEAANGVVVYCGHGPRAELAKHLLALRGIRQVACLAGHWSAWNRDGRPSQQP